jgi:hydroxymethylbilane synthase
MRIGTRASPLALAQAKLIARQLSEAQIVTITTTGDHSDGHAGDRDKSRWVQQLEDALTADEIDLAVHSAKDVPVKLAAGLSLLGASARADPQDVLCGTSSLDALPSGARVGSGSVRRAAQLLALRQDIQVTEIAGNVDTRLRKLAEGGWDAIVLARAGLQRLGREHEVGVVLDAEQFVPCPGQGTLALEGRTEDQATLERVRSITDRSSFVCLLAERALARALDASCHTPLGAYAVNIDHDRLLLRAWIGLPDGSQWIADELSGSAADPEALGAQLAKRLNSVGARQLLSQAQEMAGA